MDIREALYTTRAMRRVRPDPIPEDIQARILDAAIRAPTGGNGQAWRFLLVDAPEVRATIGEFYSECIDTLWSTFYKDRLQAVSADPESDRSKQMLRMKKSVDWAQDNFANYPLMLFAFDRADSSGSSIFPAVWNAMLQARADGVGSSLTSILSMKADEVHALLSVPDDKGWRMACCVPMGFPTGRWGVAQRRPVHEVSYRNSWGQPIGFEVPEPLWP